MAHILRPTRALPHRQLHHQQIRHASTDPSTLSPDSFGRKARLAHDEIYPIPQWRQPKPTLHTTLADPSDTTTTTTSSPALLPYDFPRARDAPIPRYRSNPAITPGFTSFLKYRILRMREPPNPHTTAVGFNVITNPYQRRKTWPPILTQMTEREQFHYEKKFRRRLLTKTKSLRYNWDRWALFARRFGVGALVVYFAFVSEPGPTQRIPSDGLRYWCYGLLLRMPWPEPVRERMQENYEYYLKKHKRQWDPYNLEGWDSERAVNTLPGRVAPAINMPIGDPVAGRDY